MATATANDTLGCILGLRDQAQIAAGLGFSFSDSISLTDAAATSLFTAFAVADTFSFTDAQARLLAGFLSNADSISLTDVAGAFGTGALTLNDLLALSDILGLGRGGICSDLFSFSDAAAIQVNNIGSTKRIPFQHLARGLRGTI